MQLYTMSKKLTRCLLIDIEIHWMKGRIAVKIAIDTVDLRVIILLISVYEGPFTNTFM